jgi:hypothetical protein
MLALLENTGRILLVPLIQDPRTRVLVEETAKTVATRLGTQTTNLGATMRWDKNGRELWAVDPAGRVVVVQFESDTT